MFRYAGICLLMILLLSGIGFAGKYTKSINSAVDRFSTPDFKDVKLAMNELARLPKDADEDLLAKFNTASVSEKIVLIEVFALRKQVSACEDIIEVIEFLPESAASRIAAALDKIGDIGWQTLVKRIEAKNKQGVARSPKLEKVYQLLVRERILNFYQDRVESRRFAYYIDEYTEIFKFGKIALDVLSDMIFNKDNILGNFPSDKTDKIREFAVRSLGDSGLTEGKEIITKARSEFGGRYYGYYYNERLVEIDFSTICELSLYNLGNTAFAEKTFKLSIDNEKRLRGLSLIDQKFYRANMYLVIHKYEDAKKIFDEVIKSSNTEKNNVLERKVAYAHYKLAVIAGIQAKFEKDEEKKGTLRRRCMQSLKAAYRSGFNDFSRIFLDKNIQILWETGEFKKWIKKLRQDEKLKDLIPTWEPGKPTKLTQEEKEKTPESDSFDPFPE